MEIHVWNDKDGCWEHKEDVDCPREEVEVEHSFLWWKWKVKQTRSTMTTEEWCRRAVLRAKEIYPVYPHGVRVYWPHRGHALWKNGQWQIDTKKYDFYPLDY
jgi:hypothetical protein